MNRKSINPVKWGLNFQMDQGEVIEGFTKILKFSGQGSIKEDPEAEMGFSVVGEGDIRAQIEYSLKNIDDILREAGMDRSNIISLRSFTTDIDGFLENYDVYATWIGEAGIRPPQSLIGVARLVMKEMLVEIEVEAAI